MDLKNRLSINQRQKLTLSPGMRQSLKMLRMPLQALNDAISREAAENPLLVVEPAHGSGNTYDFALATIPAAEGLNESLTHQIAMQRLDPATAAAALYLVSELREDGYLDVPLGELADAQGLPVGILESGLSALQKCEPVGIGARNLREFLHLCLIDAGRSPELALQIVDHLDDFAEERWPRLTKMLGLDRPALERTLALLRGFPSAPVERDSGWIATRNPEISIECLPGNRLSVSLLNAAVPQLSVLDVKRSSLNDATLMAYHDRARQIRSAVLARSETLLRVANYIASSQSAFFLGDRSTISPVTRADAASAMGLHPSTLGRALAGKSLLSESSVYPLSLFFSHALPSDSGGISAFDVQHRIRKIISAETPGSPRSDDSICAQLNNEGVDIARRTVAKYRKCMRIPSSFARLHRKA